MATGKAKQTVELKKFDIRQATFHVVGDSPLIMHRWSEKAKRQILDKHMKKVVVKEVRNPEEDYKSTIYSLSDGRIAFPAAAFKNAMVRAGKALGVVMTDARVSIFIKGVYSEKDGRELIPIFGKISMREDAVKNDTGVADLRYRAQVSDWTADVTVDYMAHSISIDQVANMLNAAGYVGIGEWRPEKNGEFGRFHVEGMEEIAKTPTKK